MTRFTVRELTDWQTVTDSLAKMIKPGSIVTLQGPLGAGKTTLVQYLARTLGAPKRAISPTFALMRVYKTKKSKLNIARLVHVDAYRLENEKDLVVLDLDEELLEPATIVLIEWPEMIRSWLKGKNSIKIDIQY